jgi:hypothetical protein
MSIKTKTKLPTNVGKVVSSTKSTDFVFGDIQCSSNEEQLEEEDFTSLEGEEFDSTDPPKKENTKERKPLKGGKGGKGKGKTPTKSTMVNPKDNDIPKYLEIVAKLDSIESGYSKGEMKKAIAMYLSKFSLRVVPVGTALEQRPQAKLLGKSKGKEILDTKISQPQRKALHKSDEKFLEIQKRRSAIVNSLKIETDDNQKETLERDLRSAEADMKARKLQLRT